MNDELLEKIGRALTGRHETVAVAESVTSGQLQATLSLAPDATLFFQGGITVYNLQQKYRHLQIDPAHALSCNCVSETIACDMATNVSRLFLSDWGMGVTGYAAPIPEVGIYELFAYYAIAHKGIVADCGLIKAAKREMPVVQKYYVDQILKKMELLLKAGKKS